MTTDLTDDVSILPSAITQRPYEPRYGSGAWAVLISLAEAVKKSGNFKASASIKKSEMMASVDDVCIPTKRGVVPSVELGFFKCKIITIIYRQI